MHRIYIETANPEGNKKTNEYRFFEYLLEILDLKAEVIGIGGKNKLPFFEAQFKDTTELGYKNLVIIDADGAHNITDWNFHSEVEKIKEIKDTIGVEFEVFFLPNHQNEGDFEILLEKIVNQKHFRIVDCHKNFEDCIKQFGEYNTPNQKARMYGYISSFKMSQSKEESFKNKGDWFFHNNEYWDFNSPALQTLKDFLILHLS